MALEKVESDVAQYREVLGAVPGSKPGVIFPKRDVQRPVKGVFRSSIQKYRRQSHPPRRSGQTWLTFLHTQAEAIWACDFIQVTDIFFRALFAFVLVELGSRRVLHVGVTRSQPMRGWPNNCVKRPPLACMVEKPYPRCRQLVFRLAARHTHAAKILETFCHQLSPTTRLMRIAVELSRFHAFLRVGRCTKTFQIRMIQLKARCSVGIVRI